MWAHLCESVCVHVMVIQDAFIFQRQSVQMGFLQMRCGGGGGGGSVGGGQLVVMMVVRWWWCWLAGGGGRGGVWGRPGRWG